MKRAIIVLLLFAATSLGQQRNSLTSTLPSDATLPAGSAGTVTLALAEYNRLVELASHKPKASEAAPLPFVLSRAAFRLRVEEQTLLGTLGIDGALLEQGPTKVPLTNGLTILQAQRSSSPL